MLSLNFNIEYESTIFLDLFCIRVPPQFPVYLSCVLPLYGSLLLPFHKILSFLCTRNAIGGELDFGPFRGKWERFIQFTQREREKEHKEIYHGRRNS